MQIHFQNRNLITLLFGDESQMFIIFIVGFIVITETQQKLYLQKVIMCFNYTFCFKFFVWYLLKDKAYFVMKWNVVEMPEEFQRGVFGTYLLVKKMVNGKQNNEKNESVPLKTYINIQSENDLPHKWINK